MKHYVKHYVNHFITITSTLIQENYEQTLGSYRVRQIPGHNLYQCYKPLTDVG